MKKLLSICFLSIFLMMFGMQAQAQRDCCFQLSNPAADTLHGFANLPGGNLPLSHYMSPLVFGATDVYDMIFSDANCLGIDEGAKVSVELELWCDGENILDGQHDLSRYCNITLQTNYEELHWVGTPMLQENYSFVYEYPGAIPIFSGTYNISNVAFDYFYFRFLTHTRSRIVVTWNQIFRDVQLIVHIRERINGTDNSLYWNSHVEESEYYQIGGHQSQPSRVLASDTLSTDPIIEKNDTIKDCEPVIVGMPPYTMDTTGDYKIAYVDTSCGYRIDSIVNYNYTHFVHPTTPTLSDSTITYCQRVASVPISLDPEPNDSLRIDHGAEIVPYWSLDGATFYYADTFTPNTDTVAGTYTYYVKRHDNVTQCESEVDTFQVVITPIPDDPHVTDTLVEYCLGETPVALTYAAPAGQQVLWGEDVDNITSTTAPVPTATAAGTKVYYLKLQDTTTVNQCISDGYDSITVKVYDNPTVTITTDNDTLCFGDKASMAANPATLTTYQWQIDGVDVTDSTNATFSYTNNVTDTTAFQFMVKVTELHVVKSCNAADTIDILAYPTIGAPTPVRGDTAICGPGTVTREVANGTHASTSTWYAKDKTTVLGTGTTYTKNYTETDTLYVSSSNDFGCETPKTDWLRIIVTVNSIPQITLTTDHVGDSVCAEEDLIIYASITSAKSPLTYVWTGVGLNTATPYGTDSVKFNYAIAGVYTDTLTVTDANGCIGDATIDITVDTLPVIVKDVNYTVKNNDYCVGVNGKIEFTTPDYINYSIDSAATWHASKVFAPLAAGDYYLVVEDARGCKNHANHEVIIDAPIMPVLTLTDSANTRCEAPFNGKLIASATPAATYNYQLNDGAFQADSVFSALEDGTYTVIVKDMTTGCRDTATHAVTNGRVTPVLTLVQNPNTHCDPPYGGSIAVTAMNPADASYQYRLVKGIDTSAYQLDTLFSALKDTTYTVIAQDIATACLGNKSITVLYDGVKPTASITALPEICYGDTNLVTLVPGGMDVIFDYWTYSGTVPDSMINLIKYKQSFSMRGFPAGKHTFTAHFHDTVTHCTNTVTDTLRIIPVNIDLVTIPYDAHVCSYDSVKVYCRYFPDDVTDTIITYNWYAREYHYSTSGRYDTVWVSPAYDNRRVSIVVYDNHGCSNSKFVDLNVWPLPALTINVPEQNYCQNTTTNINVFPSSTSPYTYEWKKDGAVLTGETGSHLAIAVGTVDFNVTVTVTDAHNCVSDSTFDVNVIEIPGAPIFTPDTQYFCDNNVLVDTTVQNTPQIGTFNWLTPSANVAKTTGKYVANYVNTENGVSCYSANDTVEVIVTGAPVFTVAERYNSETTVDTAHVRCFEAGAGDTLHITVTPAASATLEYSYKLNGVDSSANMIITRTEPGTYIDTVYIKATAHHALTTCYYDTTVYYYLTINALPTVPDNFPNSYNGGDSTIFYCQGGTATYNFNLGINQIATYNGSATAPTTAYDNVVMVITDTMTHCSNTFSYDIVEVATPTVKLTSDLADDCSDTLRGKVIATVTPAYDATYERVYTWTPASVEPASPHSKYVNTDTITYTFREATNDTIVTANVTINVDNGAYSASCVSADSSFIVTFQPAPTKPVMADTVAGYVTVDSIAYCDGSTFTITAANFTTSTGATIHMVDGDITPSTAIDTIYRVVANNNAAPYCPSDTLKVKVHKKRMPAIPVFDTVYYCAGTAPVYTITKLNANDTITYYDALSTLLPGQPDTAGVFTMRVEDKLEGCYKDSTLVIVEVALPTATITNSTNWHNDTICEGSTINETYTFTTVPHFQHTAIETFAWKDIVSTTNTATLTATPTADTSVTFYYHLVDTVANSFSHIACAYNFDSTITYTFFETPKISLLTKDTAFCAGDTVIVTEDFFTLLTTGTELVPTPSLPDTFAAASGTVVAHARYTSFHSCVSADSTITVTRNELPIVAITPHNDTICYGDTSILKVTGAYTYEWSTGATIDSIFAVDSIKYSVIGTDAKGCKNVDTAKVNFHPIFTVELSPDTTVCVGDSLMISATVTGSTAPFELTWYKNDVSFDTDGGVLSGIEMSKKVGPDSSAIVNGFPVPTLYKIYVEDSYGCKRAADENVIRIAASNRPAFIFRQIDSTKNIHSMEVHSGDAAGFEMYITNECHDETERVFVAVQIYKNGVAITDAELGTSMNYIISNYNTSYDFDVNHENAPALMSVGVNSCYFDKAKYFFPNSEFINYTAYSYDWVYMHFLTAKSGSDPARKITVRTGAWKPESKGVYTFSFAVIKAGPHTAEIGQLYKGSLRVGGYNGHTGMSQLDTVAFDTFDIYVDSTFVGASTTPVVGNPTVVTTSPEESASDKAIDMNVYPNPASNNVNVVLSGVEGQTVITVHDMSGKAVTSMRVELDGNNQIINLPVDNFSQGIYFIKAVNGSAVMTKKLIIAR